MTWIMTYSGVVWRLDDPRPENVRLDDIAHALSQLCRFTGHTGTHYSVAQHSVLVSKRVEQLHPARPMLQLAALLHDAAEAYLGDWNAPLKKLLRSMKPTGAQIPLPGPWDYIALIVDKHEQAIAEWAELPGGSVFSHAAVKRADKEALRTEQRDLMPDSGNLKADIEPWPDPIRPWSASKAHTRFAARFERLYRSQPGGSLGV